MLDSAGEWDLEGPQWEIFHPTPADLGCDIYLTELTAEKLCHITEESEAQTSHTRTPAPSETSEDMAASEPEQIQVLSLEPPSTGEQRLVALAESCHDPSHGGSYMAEGAFYIRIGLPPRVVSGDCLALSRLWTDFS